MENFKEIAGKKKTPELLQMVYAFKEWSPEMLSAVQSELLKRNALPPDIEENRKKLIQEEDNLYAKGREASALGIIGGWLAVSGLLGTFIGYHYAFSKVKSSFTDKVYFKYNESSRKKGKYLFYTSIAFAIGIIIYSLQPS